MIVCVENDDVPAAEIITVVALPRIAGDCAKVREVPVGVSASIFVIARRGTSSCLLASPGWLIALLVLVDRPVFVGVVPCREYDHFAGGARDHFVQEVRRQRVILLCAGRHVARPDEHWVVGSGCSYRGGRQRRLVAITCVTTGENRRDRPVHRARERNEGKERK